MWNRDYLINVTETTVDSYEKNGIKSQSYHIHKSIPGRVKYLNVKGKTITHLEDNIENIVMTLE